MRYEFDELPIRIDGVIVGYTEGYCDVRNCDFSENGYFVSDVNVGYSGKTINLEKGSSPIAPGPYWLHLWICAELNRNPTHVSAIVDLLTNADTTTAIPDPHAEHRLGLRDLV